MQFSLVRLSSTETLKKSLNHFRSTALAIPASLKGGTCESASKVLDPKRRLVVAAEAKKS